MSTGKLSALLLVGAALLVLAQPIQAAPAVCDYEGCTWLGTGVLTRIDGQTLYMLGQDNKTYTIAMGGAEVVFDSFTPGATAMRTGDSIRVYGTILGQDQVRATRVRVCNAESTPAVGAEPGKEIKIIVEKPAESTAISTLPSATWTGRGLITDIDYSGRRLKVRTSAGQFSINTGRAQFINGSKGITFGMFNQGDAVTVAGTLIGLNEVEAAQVSVTRTRSDAENAPSQMPLSIAGVIQQIDHASFTFRMWTETTPIVVSVDKETIVQQHMYRMAFMDLKPGMRIKMSGYGSLGTGYVAKHIQIISVAP